VFDENGVETVTLKHITYEIQFHPDARTLVFRIIDLDKRFWVEKGLTKEFKASNGFTVQSDYGVQLFHNGFVYLCGWDLGPKGSFTLRFASISERVKYKQQLRIALREWDNNWPGWAEGGCGKSHHWKVTDVVRFGVVFGHYRCCLDCGKAQTKIAGKGWVKAPTVSKGQCGAN
jgi:hypothetical protein